MLAENTHEPIVTKEMFEQANQMTGIRQRSCGKTGEVHVFSGKVRCLECGERLRKGKYADSKGGHQVLRCSRQIVAKDCAGCTIRMDELAEIVLERINCLGAVYFDEKEVEQMVSVSDDKAGKIDKVMQNSIIRQQSLLKSAENALKHLYLDKTKGVLSEEEFCSLKASLSADMEQAQEALRLINQEKERKGDDNKSWKERRKATVQAYKKLDSIDRQIVLALIDTIYVGQLDKKTRRRTVEIAWEV